MKEFKFKIDGKDYDAQVAEQDNGVLAVTLNGSTYAVEVPALDTIRRVLLFTKQLLLQHLLQPQASPPPQPLRAPSQLRCPEPSSRSLLPRVPR